MVLKIILGIYFVISAIAVVLLGILMYGMIVQPSPVRKMDNFRSYERSAFPNVVLVRGHRWYLEQDKFSDEILNFHHALGETYCQDATILVKKDLPYAEERDTVMHELLHAGTCTESKDGKIDNLYYNSSSQDSHEGIYRIAQYITELEYENPELTHYLAGN